VAIFDRQEQPSGMFAYDPNKDTWQQIKPANPIPPHKTERRPSRLAGCPQAGRSRLFLASGWGKRTCAHGPLA